jgi:multidrug efflux system outer membrane protein
MHGTHGGHRPDECPSVGMRYRGGTANYLEVLDSQRSLFNAELSLAHDRNNEYQGLVQLYKALGGGWQVQ